uniref:NACHT domain-containing protein n=1 Tax=Branchiostoma floridae TaxID=7739 RepID=C3YNT8_BRAFL|eukprot:XP_002602036.1 hypothetical protein BRAFLDRAFT_82625 [Branchiostoma floridae]
MALSKPSSPDPVYTPGTARGAKLAALLVDEGTSLVRKIFEDEVRNMNPPSLRGQLQRNKRYLCQCGLRYLNSGQRKTLYPASGDVPDTAQGFDISLLELLLKELCQNPPYSGERDRLRRFRNANYGHRPSTNLSEGDFDRLWKELTDILAVLGGDRNRISRMLNSSIDRQLAAEHFALLDRLYKEDMEVKQALGSLKKGQDGLKQGQDSLKEGQDSLKEGQDSLKEGQDSLKEGQDGLKEGQDGLKNGQDSLKNGQGCLKEGQDSLQKLPPDAVDDVIGCLKNLYATEYAHVRPLPWCEDLNLHLGEVYTNLQLQYRDGRGRFQDTDTIVNLADIYSTCIRKVEDMHGDFRSAIRKIRVEGDPGIGKSCSCQKLAFDWSCGKLNRFKVVFFLEMRHLSGKVKDAIFKQLLPEDTKTTPDQLWSYIQENQDDVLFILDGLDELSQAAREVTDVVKLIQGKILRNCHVLVTSRPYHCVKDLRKCHQFYRIVGYTKEHSDVFIRKYFCQSPESASKLVKQLHSNSNLAQIVVNPLCNLLICVLWDYNNKELPSSKAELYQDIVYSVAKRFCKKRDPDMEFEGDQLTPDVVEALQDLGKLSWEGLEQEQLQFNIDEITKKYGTTADNMLNMGLLTRDYSFSRIRPKCYCAFLHKTFQEYMAARYISGLVMDESSREEGMKCVCRLFGLSDASVVDRELVISCHDRYREVQNWLLLILGENIWPIIERLAEELKKGQTDEDRDTFSFFVIMWLGRTCAGGELAEIVAPCLSQHATDEHVAFNNHHFGEYTSTLYQRNLDHINWVVGLAYVLAFQKKLSLHHNTSVIRHLTFNFVWTDAAQHETFGLLERALSDYDKLRSVTLYDIGDDTPLQTFIPRCRIERVVIRNYRRNISHMLLLSTLEHLSAVSTIEHAEVIVRSVSCVPGERGVDFTELERRLANMIASHSRLRFLRFEVDTWEFDNRKTSAFCNLTATLQSISEHARLEVFMFMLIDAGFGQCVYDGTIDIEIFDVEPMVHELTECLKKNKVLKTLWLGWGIGDIVLDCGLYDTHQIFTYRDCSDESLSRLCSAIRENRTLETLVVKEMLPYSDNRAAIISELMRNKPSNYKELSITLTDRSTEYGRCLMHAGHDSGGSTGRYVRF